MGIAEALQGPIRQKRQKQTAKKKTVKQTDLWAIPRPKPKSLEERFENPIIKVDIRTGEIYINRLPEHWNGKNTGTIFPGNFEKNRGKGRCI